VNAQGNVVGLTNSSGDLVIEYVYDPWGSLLETKIGVSATQDKTKIGGLSFR
jgi:YD repeat-containing protein